MMRLHEKIIPAARITGAVVAIWAWVLISAYAVNLVRAPFQLEYREGVMLQTTGALLQGHNPLVAESQPQYFKMYGIVYHWVVVPLAALFGNTLWLHRLVSILAYLLAAVYVGWVLVRRKTPWGMALAGAALIFANQLFYTNPLSRPDGLGFLFYVLAAFLPWTGGFSRKSLVLSAILGVLAFYTKSYFMAAVGFVALYLLLTRRWRAFWEYSLFFGILMVVSSVLINWIYPYYFYDTLLIQFLVGSREIDFFVYQSILYVTIYAGMFLILAGLASAWLARRWRGNSTSGRHWIPDFPALGLLLSILIIGLSLGWHRGTLMTYYFHLITPFLVVVFFEQVRSTPRLTILAYLALVVSMYANLIVLGVNLTDVQGDITNLGNIPDLGHTDWDLIRQRIAASQKILDSPAISAEMLAQGREVVNNGHNELYGLGLDANVNFFLFPPPDEVNERMQATLDQVRSSVRSQSYDWIVLARDEWGALAPAPFLSMADLHAYYQKYDEVVVEMPQGRQTWTLEFWQPKP